MSDTEAADFLADVHVGILAIEHEGHGPLALPIWYQYEDGDVIIGMGGGSLKAKLLRAAGRATLTVQTETAPYRYVSVEGPVTVAAEQRGRLLDGQPLPRGGTRPVVRRQQPEYRGVGRRAADPREVAQRRLLEISRLRLTRGRPAGSVTWRRTSGRSR